MGPDSPAIGWPAEARAEIQQEAVNANPPAPEAIKPGLEEQAAAQTTNRGRTAIARTELSRPVALAITDGLLRPDKSVFDYGCGRGGDVKRLQQLGYEVSGWDPLYAAETQPRPADIVNLGYVINVIESIEERAEVIQDAWKLTHEVLIVAARLDSERAGTQGAKYRDGTLSAKGTFQKFFAQDELRDWIDGALGTRSIAASPGIYYVFRDPVMAQTFLASRIRRRPATTPKPRKSETLYELNRDILDPVIEFIEYRGRAPHPRELPEAAQAADRFGSVKAALAIVRRVIGDRPWQSAQTLARDDLVVYLALAAFRGRPPFGALPLDIQLDVKAFFGTYKEACSQADSYLYRAGRRDLIDEACQESTLGKLTPAALYVHVGAIARLCPLLRIYEGCGHTLTGDVENATIIKLNRVEPKISYLTYPNFDRDPHPALTTSVRADLRTLTVKIRHYDDWASPPILHRKETFVPADYPSREKFARLTAQEQRLGLLTDTATIGSRERWEALLAAYGLRFSGHRLIRQRGERA